MSKPLKISQQPTRKDCLDLHIHALTEGEKIRIQQAEFHQKAEDKKKAKRQKIISEMSYESKTGLIKYKGELCKIISPKKILNPTYINVEGERFPTNKLIFTLLNMDIFNYVVVHLDGNKLNNQLLNLELMTKHDSNRYHFKKRQNFRLNNIPKQKTNYERKTINSRNQK